MLEFLNYHFLSEICLEIFIKVSWRWPYPYWLALLFGSSSRFSKGVPNLKTKVRNGHSKSNLRQIPFHVFLQTSFSFVNINLIWIILGMALLPPSKKLSRRADTKHKYVEKLLLRFFTRYLFERFFLVFFKLLHL